MLNIFYKKTFTSFNNNLKLLYIMSDKISINIEYCGKWNYENRFILLKDKIEESFPNKFDINGNVGRKSSFEVVLNDNIIYSKLESKIHPDYSVVVNDIKHYISRDIVD